MAQCGKNPLVENNQARRFVILKKLSFYMRDGERTQNTGHDAGNGKSNAKGMEHNTIPTPHLPNGKEKGADLNKDVYDLDENLFPAGPYYNVRAARMAQAEVEHVVGVAVNEKRKEAGFTLAGDKRSCRPT
jgi:hypothetical protein